MKSFFWIICCALVGGGVTFYYEVTAKKLGLTLQRVTVIGRNRTTPQEVLWALSMKKDDLIWCQPLTYVKNRLENLPWIQEAILRRQLPSTLEVHLIEKEPMAIWQNKSQKCVVDMQGQPIKGVSDTCFPHLIVITGHQSPQHFAELYAHLKSKGAFLPIRGATFLRSGRWNLYLKNGVIIKMPEGSVAATLDLLATIWKRLPENKSIDLRFSDAVIFEPIIRETEVEL